jgi:hypothetical protein
MPNRAYLPHGLTSREKSDPQLKAKLSRCIRKVEQTSCPKGTGSNYKKCRVNPAAVCRKSVEGLGRKRR